MRLVPPKPTNQENHLEVPLLTMEFAQKSFKWRDEPMTSIKSQNWGRSKEERGEKPQPKLAQACLKIYGVK